MSAGGLCLGLELKSPATCADCVAFASDPDGVAAAEAQLDVLVAALSPWDAQPPRGLAWKVRTAPRDTVPAPLRRASKAAALALRKPGEPPRSIATNDAWQVVWREAVAAGLGVGERSGGAPSTSGMAFAALPNPFVALEALAALGYALEELTENDTLSIAPTASLSGDGFGAYLHLPYSLRARSDAHPNPH